MIDKETGEMVDLTKEDMDAVAKAFRREERRTRIKRLLFLHRCLMSVVVAACALVLALVWWLIREDLLADCEEIRRNPQGALARVHRRATGETVYGICDRAARAVFLLPDEGRSTDGD